MTGIRSGMVVGAAGIVKKRVQTLRNRNVGV